jgi:hypothetical protein
VNDRQLGERLRRAFETEQPPAVSAAEILRRAEAAQSKGQRANMQDREPTGTRLGPPALLPGEARRTLGAAALDRPERQRRELEEVRRSFTEIGTRMGSLFEPAQERQAQQAEHEQPAEPAKPVVASPRAGRRVPGWALPAVLALVCLLAGGGLGFLLHRPAGPARPASTAVVSATTIQLPPGRIVVPAACLETARRADQMIDLYTRNIRDSRLTLALKAYTLASQACRKDASP